MYKCFISFLLLFLLFSTHCTAQDSVQNASVSDSTAASKVNSKKQHHQLRLGIDLYKPAMNFFMTNKKSYEATVDYTFKNDLLGVVEFGAGGGDYVYENLSYKSSNTFVKIGVNKSLFPRFLPEDWDIVFIGVRYGLGFVNRGEATYFISSGFFSPISGVVPAEKKLAHWAEITGGVRVELWKGLGVGWNIRGKFLLNPKSFLNLPPYYISGYGLGEKNSVFDFNFYLTYALRW